MGVLHHDHVMRLIALAVLLVGLAGCGGGPERAETTPTRTIPPPEIEGTSPLVPTVAVGSAPEGAGRVIRSWAAAVRREDWGRAADLVSTRARVQTGGEVETLATRNHVLAWNASLPCAAKVERMGGARGYAIVRFRLARRRGAACSGGVGNVVRAAIRVADGRIVSFYLLS